MRDRAGGVQHSRLKVGRVPAATRSELTWVRWQSVELWMLLRAFCSPTILQRRAHVLLEAFVPCRMHSAACMLAGALPMPGDICSGVCVPLSSHIGLEQPLSLFIGWVGQVAGFCAFCMLARRHTLWSASCFAVCSRVQAKGET